MPGSALPFGAAHSGGGSGYMGLGRFAGAGYGMALLRAGRLEVSTLVHFTVNAWRFTGFTRPRTA